jgi:sphingomyelin phosphodiesterase acid-like 3
VSALQQQSKHPSAIVISGDFLRHKFNLWIQKKKWPYDSERLARKTMQFVALFIRQRFPQTQILTTLGNNDSGCDDYASTPYSEFNRAFADIWEPAMDHGISAPGAHDRLIQSFAPLGDYSVPLQAANAGTKVRVIAYNGIYGTPRYKNKCGDPKESSAAEELAWLKSELEASRQAGERVWLLTHVPLGRDIATLLVKKKHKGGDEPFDRSKHCAQHDFIGMLQEPVELEFEKLLQSYAGTIQTVLAGHTHLNEFRIYPGNIPALITPSIGPIHGNNPAFAVLAYDAKAGRLEDSRVFYLNLNTATRSDQPWALEYDFQDLYQQPDLSAASLTQALAKNKTTSPVEIFQWAKLLNSQSAPPDYLSNHWDLFVCAVDHLSREEFEKCVCTPQKQQAP